MATDTLGQPPAGAVEGAEPIGMGALREILVAVGVLAFLVLWVIVLVKVWDAPSGKPPKIDDVLIGAAGALAGAVGAGFALAMGLEKKKPPAVSLAIGPSGLPKLDTDQARSWILTIGIWGYVAVAGGAVATWLLNRSETPDDVRVLAIGFASYVLALVTSAFGAVRAAD